MRMVAAFTQSVTNGIQSHGSWLFPSLTHFHIDFLWAGTPGSTLRSSTTHAARFWRSARPPICPSQAKTTNPSELYWSILSWKVLPTERVCLFTLKMQIYQEWSTVRSSFPCRLCHSIFETSMEEWWVCTSVPIYKSSSKQPSEMILKVSALFYRLFCAFFILSYKKPVHRD